MSHHTIDARCRTHSLRNSLAAALCLALLARAPLAAAELFAPGEAASPGSIPANERGIVALTLGHKGEVFGGTTGRAAHLFKLQTNADGPGELKSLARLPGGIGLSYGLIALPDGSLIAGTQADPTRLTPTTDAKQVGRLLRFVLDGDKPARVEELDVPVEGQGIYTLAYLPASGEIVGNTWPDGHFFAYQLTNKKFTDLGPIAGYRTYETPQYAAKINFNTQRDLHYSRQVSRAIAVDPHGRALTAGADGFLYRYDPAAQKIAKLKLRLPATPGREPWASLDAVTQTGGAKVATTATHEPWRLIGGTSDGYLFELRAKGDDYELHAWGKPLMQGGIQGLVARTAGSGALQIDGVGGWTSGMPRSFHVEQGPSTFEVRPGDIPIVAGRASMTGFGAIVADAHGNVYAGECDRIGRLARYSYDSAAKPVAPKKKGSITPSASTAEVFATARKLPCQIVFAPPGTTTEASGYTAIERGRDGNVYVGSARYGDYGWLMRFPGTELLGKSGTPKALPTFMDKIVGLQELTGEHRDGIHTQGKIHAKIVVGADGRVWFASKQAHESFAARPEFDDADGFPGGHLCYYDPKTGFSRSVGILKHQEGLMGGVIDDARGMLYLRSEPKNHFLVYDIKTGATRDCGHVGASCRYMAIDDAGMIYTMGRDRTLCRYNPETGYVDDLTIKIAGPDEYKEPYALAMGPNGKLYGATGLHPWIMEFDLASARKSDAREVTMRNVAPAAPEGFVAQNIHAGTFGLDGKFYYPLNSVVLEQQGKKAAAKPVLMIMRYDPATEKTELVGVPDIQGLDEDKVRHTYNRENEYRLDHMQGAAIGSDGTLYLLDIYPQLNVACFPGLTAGK